MADKVWTIPVEIAATAYVRAASEAEAVAKLAEAIKASPELEVPDDGLFSGRDFDDPELPDVSLAPAMTICVRDDEPLAVEDCVFDPEDVKEFANG